MSEFLHTIVHIALLAICGVGEIIPFFIAYVLTEEGRTNVFGKWSERLNTHATSIFWIGISVLAVVCVLKFYFQHKGKETIKEKDEKIKKLCEECKLAADKLSEVERLVPSTLRGILEVLKSELELNTNSRVSLYLVEQRDGQDHYFCQERCSSNLMYEKKSCRLSRFTAMFEKLWSEGELYVSHLPDPSKKKNLDSYCKKCKELWGVKIQDVKNVRFKGRCYLGKRVDYNDVHHAFLLVSTKDATIAGFTEEEAKKVVSTASQKIGAVVNSFRAFIPSPTLTKQQEGF